MKVGRKCEPRSITVRLSVKGIQVVAQCVLDKHIRVFDSFSVDQSLEADHLCPSHLDRVRSGLCLDVNFSAV